MAHLLLQGAGSPLEPVREDPREEVPHEENEENET
jgi:hypothetical protein